MRVSCALAGCDASFEERTTYDGRPLSQRRKYCSPLCARQQEKIAKSEAIKAELLAFPRTCKACGEDFTARTRGQSYCSPQCRDRWRKKKENANLRMVRGLKYDWGIVRCGACGVEFDNRTSYIEGKKPTVPRRFCTMRCRARLHGQKDRVRRLAKYGLTLSDYEDLEASQGGVCAICKLPETHLSPQSGKVLPLHVDHDHDSGDVRGLLCSNCNTAIGLLCEDADVLMAAIDYLHSAPNTGQGKKKEQA